MDPKQAEEAEKRAKELAEAKKIKEQMAAEAAGGEIVAEEGKELSDDEKLKLEANKILRS